MASIIETIALGGVRKSDGTVNAGGRVFLTRPGSANISVTAYADRDKSAAATVDGGGYLLDGAGRAALFIDEPCNVRVEDSDGVSVGSFTIEPSTSAGIVEVINPGFTGIDPVSGQYVSGGRTYLDDVLSSIYSSLGGVDGKFLGAYGTTSLRVAQMLGLVLTPQMFGAVGNGSSDDSVPWQLMADAHSSSRIPCVIPPASYVIGTTVTFQADALVLGVGTNSTDTLGSRIIGSNGTTGPLVFGADAIVSGLYLTHSSACTGAAITVGARSTLRNVFIGATPYTTGLAAASGAHAIHCELRGSTNAFTGAVVMNNCTVSGASSTGTYVAQTAASDLSLFTSNTADMANGGNTTPTIGSTGQVIAYQRIRGTSAGSGAVNATSVPVGPKTLYLDLFNNSGGAFTFNLNAQYHGTSAAPAPANGQRIVASYTWDPTGAVWQMLGITGSFA